MASYLIMCMPPRAPAWISVLVWQQRSSTARAASHGQSCRRGCTQCALCALSRPAPMDPLSRFMHIMRGGGGGGGGGITSEGGDSDQFPHDNRSVITAAEYVSPLIGGGGAANREHILLRHH